MVIKQDYTRCCLLYKAVTDKAVTVAAAFVMFMGKLPRTKSAAADLGIFRTETGTVNRSCPFWTLISGFWRGSAHSHKIFSTSNS